MSDEHMVNTGKKRTCYHTRTEKVTTNRIIPTAMRRATDPHGFSSAVSKCIVVVFAMIITLCPMISMAEEMALHQPLVKCETIHDLDFEECKPEQLGIDQLKIICDSIGLNVEVDIFPYLFDNDEGSSSPDRVYEQKDYVAAAYECIMVAEETESDLNSLDDIDDNYLAEVLQESPDILAQIVVDVMDNNPGLIEELVAELKQSEPDVWNAINPETQKGREDLLGKPQLVSELLSLLLGSSEPGIMGDIVLSDDSIPDIIESDHNEEL